MSYDRVLPRDLFNEANFLKCVGQLWLRLEGNDKCEIIGPQESEGFAFELDMYSGDLSLENVHLKLGSDLYTFKRGLNSRDPWPLYITTEEEEDILIFNDNGKLSGEFLDFVESNSPMHLRENQSHEDDEPSP